MTFENLGVEYPLGIDRSVHTNDAFVSRLFDNFRGSVYRYLLLITRSPGHSEDLVQETFVRLLAQLNEGKSIDNVRAWLFRVGHNLALNRLRSDERWDSLSEDHITRHAEERTASGVPDPEDLFLRKEREHVLGAAVAKLPVTQRHCLLLRREGLRYREIASVLGIGETTVLDHIHRAIERLEREFHER